MPTATTRAMWVWESWSTLQVKENVAPFLDFFQRPFGHTEYAYNRILLSPGAAALVTDQAALRYFISQAHLRGIAVEYLDGQNTWAQDGGKAVAKALCNTVLSFNTGTTTQEDDFDGIHLDIEPHTLGAIWRQNTGAGKDEYNDNLEDNIMEVYASCRASITAQDPKVTLAGDFGDDYSYHATDLWGDIMSQKVHDYVAIMNYYDDQASFINGEDGIGGLVQNLKNSKLPLLFGAETIMPPYAPDKSSFWQEGYGHIEKLFQNVYPTYRSSAKFAGFATHHYNSYKLMSYDLVGTLGQEAFPGGAPYGPGSGAATRSASAASIASKRSASVASTRSASAASIASARSASGASIASASAASTASTRSASVAFVASAATKASIASAASVASTRTASVMPPKDPTYQKAVELPYSHSARSHDEEDVPPDASAARTQPEPLCQVISTSSSEMADDHADASVPIGDSRRLCECLTIVKHLASGSFSDVALGEVSFSVLPPRAQALLEPTVSETVQVAVKCLMSDPDEKSRQDFVSEAKLMASFTHPNVVHLLAALVESEPYLVLLEFVQYGDLRKLLQKSKLYSLWWTQNEQIHTIRQIALGMEYLGTLNFVHRDLTARNCLVGQGMAVKITDFGLSRKLVSDDDCDRMQTLGKLPVKWMAPETMTYRKCSSMANVWSFGVTAWECFSYGATPYGTMKAMETLAHVEAGGRLPMPEHCTAELFSLMLSCWDMSPEKRPTFAQLVKALTALQDGTTIREIGAML
ncbi:hypothetical protein CAOG_04955 [Capsaspora owczarzaki ATCC 30864]|uniref:hypothetical protein n=1 Tax=Capsaspora owczarzaki (strain ATCC 30864) TaxID=595528 RepID=UPI00035268C7|nr:hypothetical protein CAOG_04955 [Capsaspora owczarzaki ATCC 30864]|eukprot:XP_004347706.2 hypothetical protein CAOG_04955 [Capsaspora owczarzaki ATCC 30864]